jgi:hypothetical protein
VSPASIQTFIDPSLTLTPSVNPNSNYEYVIMVSDGNCLKYFCVYLYRNHQLYRDFLITLYKHKLEPLLYALAINSPTQGDASTKEYVISNYYTILHNDHSVSKAAYR